MSPFKIAIIGAGPGGCALARILTRSSVASSLTVTVFEGETGLNARSQGGTLDLRQNTGLATIRAAGLIDEFSRQARYDCEAMIVSDKSFVKYMQLADGKEDRNARAPEIDRLRLRRLLIDSLPRGTIRWGARLSGVIPSADGKHALSFRDGTNADGYDLVVGADGAWSKVRPIISDKQPFFSGVAGYTFTISEASKTMPETVEMVNGGNVLSLHDHKFLSQQRMSDDVLQITLFWREDDEKWVQNIGHDNADHQAVRRFVLEEKLADWHPQLTNAIAKSTATNTTVQPYVLYTLPEAHRWEHHPGVTCIGDAAHLMTPFAGEGVNQALTDANVLAQEIVQSLSALSTDRYSDSGAAIDKAVANYEGEMFARMAISMKKMNDMMSLSLFENGGLRQNIERWLLCAAEDELPLRRLSLPLISALTHAYYFLFRLRNQPLLSE